MSSIPWWQRPYRALASNVRARVLLPTAVLFAGTLVAMGVVAVQLFGASLDRGHRERAEYFAGMIAAGVATSMLQTGDHEIGSLLGVAAGHRSDVDAINLLRPDGTVAFSSHPNRVGALTHPVTGGPETLVLRDTPGEPGTLAVLRPLPNAEACAGCHGPESKINGWVDVHISQRSVRAVISDLARTIALAGVPAFLLLVGIAWWLLGREVVRPLRHLVTAMGRAGRGEAAVRADEGRPDELGVAARGFDATLAALRKSRTEVESFYREQMIRADRFAALGELATGLAHEIKNPLAGLSGALELIAEDVAHQPKQAEVVAEMRHQTDRLTRIMESLLSFARPPRVRIESTDVNQVLETVLFLVNQHRRAGPMSVERKLAQGLPPALADPAQLEQVFLNLALNAVQAMNGSGGRLTLRSFATDDWIQVEVADTGPGIPEEVRPHLFRPFYTTKPGGTGLGLAISARILADCGGHIDYACPASGGTTFVVKLRRADPRQAEAAA